MEFPRESDPLPPPSAFVPVNNYSPALNYALSPVNYAPAVASYSTSVFEPPPVEHPPYQEMISMAIAALNQKDGSSRQAIAKYIENRFKIPPSQTHGYELSQQLKRMKNCGQLVLNKHSYMFPESVAMSEHEVLVLEGSGTKRRAGRPPKLQPNGGLMNQQVGGAGLGVPTVNLFGGLNSCEFQFGGGNVSNDVKPPVGNDVMAPVTAPTMVYNGGAMYDAGAVANVVPIEQTDVVVVSAKRGRGRPRKVVTSAVGHESRAIVSVAEDAAAQNNVGNGPPAVTGTPPTVLGKRRRGRPAKVGMTVTGPVVNGGLKEGQGGKAMVPMEGKRGRGRPRKNVVGANGGGVLPVAKKARKVRGRPVGRSKKNALQTASLTSEMQMMAYEGLKGRVEHYQARIKQAISVVKPYLNERAVIALGALQDLEELANMDIISVPTSVQGAPVDVQSAHVNVLSAPVDLNAPVNVTAHENIQSAPLTAEAEPLAFPSAPTGETTESTFQSSPVPFHGH